MVRRDDYKWIALFEAMADVVATYRDDHAALIDILGDALAACAMQFPIVQSGENFDDICPFTFFASLAREMPGHRRKRLIECLCCVFEAEGQILSCENSESLPATYPGLHTVNDRSLRFFGNDAQRSILEIDALWSLFSRALCYADEQTPAAEEAFVLAYDRVVSLRVSGRHLLPTALSWTRPHFYLPVSCVSEVLSQPSTLKQSLVLEGARYVELIKAARNEKGAETGDPTVFGITIASWKNVHAPEACIDPDKVVSAIDSYRANIVIIRKRSQAKWSAIRTFQENWDLNACDFHGMLARSLKGYDALVPANPTFNPRKDILVFAQNEPEVTRRAFRTLFNADVPIVERVLGFEAETARLFERYRGDIIRAIPRRSSHGNYFAICAYLFLRFPDAMYLFSPSRMKALDSMTSNGARHRIADPSSVEEYQRLCEQVRTLACENESLITANDGLRDPETDWEDACHHILVDDLIDNVASVAKRVAS